jgi:hypothetical protein
VKDLEELNWIQKEYITSFLQLPARTKEIIIETLLEY